MLNRQIFQCIIAIAMCIASSQLFAIPSLQLGPGDGDWAYATDTGTWELTGAGSLNAYALPSAWDDAGDTSSTRYAYLVVSAIPQTDAGAGDVFDIGVFNDVDNSGVIDNTSGSADQLSLFDSGWGTPPPDDSNSLGSHGIFPTWFEIYKFQFNDSMIDVYNTQPPPSSDHASGYGETFKINIGDIDGNIGLHFDLFTVIGDGLYTPGALDPTKDMVSSFAPFTHDASYCVDGHGCTPSVPEPGSLALMALGLFGLG